MNYINWGWNNNISPSVNATASRRAQSVEKFEQLLTRWNVSTITHRTAIDAIYSCSPISYTKKKLLHILWSLIMPL